MRIGILSDSHGRAAMTARAVRALVDEGAELLLHLGDLETEAVIDELIGHNARIVLGNCDWPPEPLMRYARSVGVAVDHPMGDFEADRRRIMFTHGDNPALMRRALELRADYLLSGHTHRVHDERRGPTRLINPGALHRARLYTVAILDPGRDELRILEMTRES